MDIFITSRQAKSVCTYTLPIDYLYIGKKCSSRISYHICVNFLQTYVKQKIYTMYIDATKQKGRFLIQDSIEQKRNSGK